MFWWAVPVGFTGGLIFSIFGLTLLIFTMVMDFENFIDYSKIAKIIAIIIIVLLAIGFFMMATGFFFWALGEIWMPYL